MYQRFFSLRECRSNRATASSNKAFVSREKFKEKEMPDTIITGGGGGGGAGTGMLVAIVIVVLLLIAGGYIAINHGGSGSAVTVDVPKVTVNTPKS
jgi:hypothetical protein